MILTGIPVIAPKSTAATKFVLAIVILPFHVALLPVFNFTLFKVTGPNVNEPIEVGVIFDVLLAKSISIIFPFKYLLTAVNLPSVVLEPLVIVKESSKNTSKSGSYKISLKAALSAKACFPV